MMKQPTPDELLADIRAYCLDCCGGSRNAVQKCNCEKCRLWPHRLSAAVPMRKAERKRSGQISFFELIRETPNGKKGIGNEIC